MVPEKQKVIKTSRFLLCENPMIENKSLYILSTRAGEMLIDVIELPGRKFELKLFKVYEATDKQIDNTLKDAKKWLIAVRSKS